MECDGGRVWKVKGWTEEEEEGRDGGRGGRIEVKGRTGMNMVEWCGSQDEGSGTWRSE